MGDPVKSHYPLPPDNRSPRLGPCVGVRLGEIEEVGYEAMRTHGYVWVWIIGTDDIKCRPYATERVRALHPFLHKERIGVPKEEMR